MITDFNLICLRSVAQNRLLELYSELAAPQKASAYQQCYTAALNNERRQVASRDFSHATLLHTLLPKDESTSVETADMRMRTVLCVLWYARGCMQDTMHSWELR